MKNWKKRLIALFMAIALVVTMFPNSMGVSEVEAADAVNNILTFDYRWGNATTLQVNTNLPLAALSENFLADKNIYQAGSVHEVGWFSMSNANGTIVLTFNFNPRDAFAVDETYILKHGSIFGFKDGKYVLNEDYTFTWNGSSWDMAKAAPEGIGKLDFKYRYGTNKLIQVNTDLPSSTPLMNFTATQNGCKIDQSKNEYQQVGWIGMDDVDGTIVLAFHFNNAFEVGQTYKIGKGSVFGFTDGNKYTLNGDYTFTWNGTKWTMEAVGDLKFIQYRYGTSSLFQVNTDLPSDTPCKVFTADENDCKIDQSGAQQVKNIGMDNVDGTIVLTFNFDSAFETDQKYVLKQGSVFGFTNGRKYILDADYTFTWDGSAWTVETKVPEQTFTFTSCSWANSYLQVLTDIPVNSACATSDIQTEGTKQYVALSVLGAGDGQTAQLLSFNYGSNHCAEGDTLKIKKGSTITLQDGSIYVLKENWLFVFDGSSWSSAKETEITGIADENKAYIQPLLSAPAPSNDEDMIGVRPDETGSDVRSNSMSSHPREGSALVSINLPSENVTEGVHYIWNANSIIKIESTQYYLESSYVFTYLDGHWQYYKGALGDINTDEVVDSRDLVMLKRIQDSSAYDIRYDLVADKAVTTLDVKRERYILIGASWKTFTNSVEYLLAESNFNGGGEFVTFADRPADPTDPEKIQEYKEAGFNTATVTGEYSRRENGNATAYYVRMTTEEASGIDTNGKTVLTLELHSGKSATSETGGHIQLETNIATLAKNGGTGYDFLIENQKDSNENTHNITLEKSANAPAVGWCGLQEIEGIVYWTLNYNQGQVFKYQDTYTLKAGSELHIDDKTYVLDKTYKFEYTNDYRVSIENLDEAGLNVWIRNTSNKTNYFTDDILNLIQPYTGVIDGIYMGDEPFSTTDIRTSSYSFTKSKNDLELMTFDELCSLNPWFNDNLQDKYFFVNHVGMPGYNHYMKSPLRKAPTVSAYAKYYEDYNTSVLSGITSSTKKPLSFDLYPLGYDKREVQYSSNVGQRVWQPTRWQSEGIDPYYLVTMLTVANKAKEQGNIFSYYIQAQTNKTQLKTGESRALISSKEISMQLYAGMACGAKMYGYYLYNALVDNPDNGMIRPDGTHNDMYGWVQDANKEALPFADVLKTFTWQGAEFVTGSTSNNREALSLVTSDSSLNLMLDEDSDGVLTNASDAKPTNDILVGYYKKDEQGAYMVANYNDPEQVKDANEVTLKFDGCNYARVYTGTASGLTSEIVPLAADGSYTFTLKSGGGCFVIPVNAAS